MKDFDNKFQKHKFGDRNLKEDFEYVNKILLAVKPYIVMVNKNCSVTEIEDLKLVFSLIKLLLPESLMLDCATVIIGGDCTAGTMSTVKTA